MLRAKALIDAYVFLGAVDRNRISSEIVVRDGAGRAKVRQWIQEVQQFLSIRIQLAGRNGIALVASQLVSRTAQTGVQIGGQIATPHGRGGNAYDRSLRPGQS